MNQIEKVQTLMFLSQKRKSCLEYEKMKLTYFSKKRYWPYSGWSWWLWWPKVEQQVVCSYTRQERIESWLNQRKWQKWLLMKLIILTIKRHFGKIKYCWYIFKPQTLKMGFYTSFQCSYISMERFIQRKIFSIHTVKKILQGKCHW